MNLQSRTEKKGSTTMKPCGVEVVYKVDGNLEVALISLDLYSKLIAHIANLHGELINVKVISI